MQTTYCEIDLDKAKRDAFVYAIKNHYWYQMYIDDLPIWGEWVFVYLKQTSWTSVGPECTAVSSAFLHSVVLPPCFLVQSFTSCLSVTASSAVKPAPRASRCSS